MGRVFYNIESNNSTKSTLPSLHVVVYKNVVGYISLDFEFLGFKVSRFKIQPFTIT